MNPPSPALIGELRKVLGPDRVLSNPSELMAYECDGQTLDKESPRLALFPESTEEVQAVVRLLSAAGVPFTGRGAGTGLAGGALAPGAGALVLLTRMNRILDVDAQSRLARVQAGVVNLRLSREVAGLGLHYAPDPSSQQSSTIGGNINTNAGGPHTLKQGVTVNHVRALTAVLPDGELLRLGSGAEESPDLDLVGFFTGSEGTLGILTEALVRLSPNPGALRTFLADFSTVAQATESVSAIIAAGLLPAAMEMMDAKILAALNQAFHMDFPLDAGSLLLLEMDGSPAEVEEESGRVKALLQKNGARSVKTAAPGPERDALWKARKRAFGAIGRLSPSYLTQDAVIPRSRLPEVLPKIYDIAKRHNLEIANVFHAGDGNLHPCLLFDERREDQVREVLAASSEILRTCVEAGGSLTGEHGIGLEKKDYMGLIFSERDLAFMAQVRDVFNPRGLLNPCKVLPGGHGCMEDPKGWRVRGRGVAA